MKMRITGVITGTKLARIVSNTLHQVFSCCFITFVNFVKYLIGIEILEFNSALE